MKLLFFLAYLLFGMKAQRDVAIQAQELQLDAVPLERAVPREVKPAPKKRKVEIEIDGSGEVDAATEAR